MDSSPDLSLKLRRGSSDSRDTFYMDFAQGIDSDIEEVDNSAIAREPQQPPTPPLPIPQDILDAEIAAMAQMIPPPPQTTAALTMQPTHLPTVSEHDDLLPTPPPQLSSTAMSSPPASPTNSVLEMIPPPPMSPPIAAPMRFASSPPIETEDEGDDGDADEPDDADEEDNDDDDEYKSTPPPPLPPLPSNLSYIHGSGGPHVSPIGTTAPLSPPITKSPSTSPSPPITPPVLTKFTSPPPPVAHLPPTHVPATPPSESDQSQPNSPPPLPPHHDTPPQPISPKSISAELSAPTPPPLYDETNEMIAAVLAAAVEATADFVPPAPYQMPEENKSLNDDESTTITTPPSNGYSGSSILAPTSEHLGELEKDAGLVLADIPPPPGLEDEPDLDKEASGEKTPISEQQPDDVVTEDQITRDIPIDEENEEPGTPTQQTTSIASGSLKRSGSIGGATSHAASRSVSRSGSRSGSRKSSRSGSVRGSIGSRAGSIAAGSVASAAASIASGAQHGVVTSPQASIKSLRSQPSIKSQHSKHSIPPIVRSPPLSARMQSPPEGDGAPIMPTPPMMRSPPPVKSPLAMHSPPIVTSPPRVYSPPLVSSPPMRKSIIETTETDKAEIPEKSIDFTPTTAPTTSESVTTAAVSATAAAAATAATTLNYQDEHVVRPHLTSHHHYHLPHQFQHPHHQNHHPHIHGSVPVPTPTVPASYATAHILNETRHIRAASGGPPTDDDGNGADSIGRRTPPTVAPSPNLLLPSETASHTSVSPAKSTARMRDSTSHHRVTIDESNLPVSSTLTHQPIDVTGSGSDGGDGSGPPTPGSSSQQLASVVNERQTAHLALMYHSSQLTSYPVLPAIKRTHRPSFIYPPMPRVRAGDALATLFSALYGKLLVVMGIAFPMAEVISTYIPPSFYEVYYLYLYIGSMIFLFFMYTTLIWGRPKIPVNIASPTKSKAKARTSNSSESMDESDTDSNSAHNKHIPIALPAARRPSLLAPLGGQHHYGSFYLRMGAVAFGIGSMIYSGLEFGQYFELNPDTKCHNVLLALTPATRMAFIFIQMYFIFLNNEQIKVYRYKIIARFGLMHMIGTNLAVWLNVLIQETKHEILTFYNPENRTLRISHRIPGHSRGHGGHALMASDPTAHLRLPRGLKGPYQIFECRRTNIIGTLVQDASPFLFPCTIEYSLICAAILYVMWRSISRPQTPTPQRPDTISSPLKRSPHHYSVDCARAHKGLFVGILILVLTIISLILFFVLISRPDFVALAVTEVTICELLIYGTATIATLAGMIQIRHLQYDAYRSFSLDDILLVGAQTGSFLYNIFTVIAGHFTIRSDDMLVPLNALASIVQTACQTMFILDASRRQAVTPEHIRKKPGREIVTFMLVVNLAMWAISTLEKSRAESHPIQLNFYGLWAWTIITHVSMPLAIFYRFHSTVCLCEIWKRAYKLKPAYM